MRLLEEVRDQLEWSQLVGPTAIGAAHATASLTCGSVGAVSVGIVGGAALLDLDYSEDSEAEVDMNVVMTGEGALVEVQATAEKTPFSRAHLDDLLELAAGGIEELAAEQGEAVAAPRG